MPKIGLAKAPAAAPAVAITVQLDTQRELLKIGQPALDQPGMAAAAMAMARVLDDPTAVPQHPSAASQLRTLLMQLRRGEAARTKSRFQEMKEQRGG